MRALPTRAFVSRDVVHRTVGAEMVLLDLRGENCFSLDETGARIWSLLVEDPEIAAVVATLLVEFEVAEPALRAGVSQLLDELSAAGLVTLER